MTPNSEYGPTVWVLTIRKYLFRFLLWGLFFYVAYRLRFVITTVLLSIILALALDPLVKYGMRMIPSKGITLQTRRIISSVVVFLGVLSLVVLLGFILFRPFEHEMSRVIKNVPSYAKQIDGYSQKLSDWYDTLPSDIHDTIRKQDFTAFAHSISNFTGDFLKSTANWMSRVVELILIPILSFYFVVDSRILKKEFIFLIPPKRVRESLLMLREIAEITQSYVVGQLILCLIAGIVVWIGLLLLHVNYAMTMGVLAGCTRAIPIIGPIVGGIPIVCISALQSWKTGVAVLIFFTIMHLVESKFIMPKLIGYRMHLNAAVVIIVLLIGSEFFGLLGMFLAVPVAAIIKVFINFYFIQPRARSLSHP